MKNIILDTDFSSDVGDGATLLLALVLHQLGFIRLLGVVVSSSNDKAPGAANAMCIAQGVPDIPIGCWKGAARDLSGPGTWVGPVYDNYTRTLGLASTVQNGLTLYQSLLTANPGATIVAVGGGNALSELLAASPALVASNVSELAWTVGQYPTNPSSEFNIQFDPAAAADVMANWPTTITYSGYENGLRIVVGSNLKDLPAGDIFRYAHVQWDSTLKGNPAWDQQALMWATFGKALFDVVRGSNAYSNSPVTDSNVFTPDAGGKDRYTVRNTSDSIYAGVINMLMLYRGGQLAQPSTTKTVLMVPQ